MVVYEEEVIYPAKINEQSSKIRKIRRIGRIDKRFLNWNFKNTKTTRKNTARRRKKERKASMKHSFSLSRNHDSPAYFSVAQTIGDFYVRPVTEWLRLRSV